MRFNNSIKPLELLGAPLPRPSGAKKDSLKNFSALAPSGGAQPIFALIFLYAGFKTRFAELVFVRDPLVCGLTQNEEGLARSGGVLFPFFWYFLLHPSD